MHFDFVVVVPFKKKHCTVFVDATTDGEVSTTTIFTPTATPTPGKYCDF